MCKIKRRDKSQDEETDGPNDTGNRAFKGSIDQPLGRGRDLVVFPNATRRWCMHSGVSARVINDNYSHSLSALHRIYMLQF